MNHKLIFEVMPYPKTASESYANKIIGRIAAAITEMESVSMLNIPEIVEENHNGQPYYRNVDAGEFGKILREKCGRGVMINTIVAHHSSKSGFEQWLDKAMKDCGINNFVFVGAKMPFIKYPGPTVPEANLIAKSRNAHLGNIFIPGRPGEADRLLEKTRAGCRFFTSQVLFGADAAIKIIGEYAEKCNACSISPSKFYLSFAPVSSLEDIIFIKWLGADMGGEAEKRLKTAENMGQESVSMLLEVIQRILSYDKQGIMPEIGLNIGYILLHNLDLAKDLANRASELLD